MAPHGHRMIGSSGEGGQAALLMLGVLAAVLVGVLVLFGFGQALGARGHAQRAADLAAVSAAQVMRRNFARLFEPAVLEGGVPNSRHLSNDAYLALARAAALRGAVRNGVQRRRVEVAFPESRFAPTRVTVVVRDTADVRLPDDRRHPVEVRAQATAEIAADAGGLGMPGQASGGGYSGPLAYRQGKPTPHLFSARSRAEFRPNGPPKSRVRRMSPHSTPACVPVGEGRQRGPLGAYRPRLSTQSKHVLEGCGQALERNRGS